MKTEILITDVNVKKGGLTMEPKILYAKNVTSNANLVQELQTAVEFVLILRETHQKVANVP